MFGGMFKRAERVNWSLDIDGTRSGAVTVEAIRQGIDELEFTADDSFIILIKESGTDGEQYLQSALPKPGYGAPGTFSVESGRMESGKWVLYKRTTNDRDEVKRIFEKFYKTGVMDLTGYERCEL